MPPGGPAAVSVHERWRGGVNPASRPSQPVGL